MTALLSPRIVMRRRLPVTLAIISVVGLVSVATATADLQRTVTGPASVAPGQPYTFFVSGFKPGEVIYPTVQPAFCAQSSDKCEQDPCPSCAPTRIGPSGTATLRFRWPKRSLYAYANMDIAYYKWQPGSRALVRINAAELIVPQGCQRMRSTTANPQAGSVVCAAGLTRIR